jgi:hypothetical protein
VNLSLAPALVAVGGLALYLLIPSATTPTSALASRVAEAGRIAYFVGLLVLVAALAGWKFVSIG